MELSPFGSLESHLENNRDAFVAFPHQNLTQSQAQENGPVKIEITILDMIKWCMEIAQGMSHLASKKVRISHTNEYLRNEFNQNKDSELFLIYFWLFSHH